MKFIGDGVMALFESIQNEKATPTHTGRCALASQCNFARPRIPRMGQAAPPSQSLPEFSIGVAYTAAKCCCVTSARRAAESSR